MRLSVKNKKKRVIRYVTQKEVESVSVSLTLTKGEADFLYTLVRNIAGDPCKSRRRYASELERLLHSVPGVHDDGGDCSGTLIFTTLRSRA